MPASNWNTIWESKIARFKRGIKTHFITGFYLKQHKNGQIRLVQWLKSCETQNSYYANHGLWQFMIELRNIIKKLKKKLKKSH